MLLGLMEEKQQHCVEMSPDFLNPRAGAAHARVRAGLQPQTSRQGPRQARCSHV